MYRGAEARRTPAPAAVIEEDDPLHEDGPQGSPAIPCASSEAAHGMSTPTAHQETSNHVVEKLTWSPGGHVGSAGASLTNGASLTEGSGPWRVESNSIESAASSLQRQERESAGPESAGRGSLHVEFGSVELTGVDLTTVVAEESPTRSTRSVVHSTRWSNLERESIDTPGRRLMQHHSGHL